MNSFEVGLESLTSTPEVKVETQIDQSQQHKHFVNKDEEDNKNEMYCESEYVVGDSHEVMMHDGHIIVSNGDGGHEYIVEETTDDNRTVIVHEQVLHDEVVCEENGVEVEVSDTGAEVEVNDTGAEVEVNDTGAEVEVGGTEEHTVEFVSPDMEYGQEVEVMPEEVVVDAETTETVGSGIGSDFFVGSSADPESEVIQLKEEEIIETPSSETEMSVAMEMAKLSQGLIHHRANSYANGDDYYNSDSENTTPPPPQSYDDPSPEKPRMSYAQLIAEALLSQHDRMLTLSEIYGAIHKRHPYYRMDVKSWQNAIRHNLTLNPSFTKVPRPTSEGRGNYWKIEDGAEKTIFRRQIKSHHYNRKCAGLPGPRSPAATEEDTRVIHPPTTASNFGAVQIVQQYPATSTQQPQILHLKEQIVQQNGSVVFIALPANSVQNINTA